jgi:hypothetical protein
MSEFLKFRTFEQGWVAAVSSAIQYDSLSKCMIISGGDCCAVALHGKQKVYCGRAAASPPLTLAVSRCTSSSRDALNTTIPGVVTPAEELSASRRGEVPSLTWSRRREGSAGRGACNARLPALQEQRLGEGEYLP